MASENDAHAKEDGMGITAYTTKNGDMWDSIAFSQMGDYKYTDILMRANLKYREYFIFPSGIELTIPTVNRITENKLIPPWKRAAG